MIIDSIFKVSMFFLFFAFVNGEFDYTEYGETAEYSKYLNQATAIRQEVFTTRNYDRYLVPIFGQMPTNYTMSQTERLHINFMLYYCKLFNLDAESQIFSATVELKTAWRDPRLVWNASRFGGVDVIFISPDLLWIPDAQIGNAKILEPVNGNTMPVAQVHSNGMIYMTTVFYVETSCRINANKFPFDKQNCTLSILSLGLDQKYISLGVEVDRGLQTLGGNGEWVIVEAIPMRYESVSLSARLEVTGFFILINRVPNFYVYVIALPCFILTMLSIVGMFWSPNIKKEQLTKVRWKLDKGKLGFQLSIGLTSLVSMTVLLDMLARAIPKTQVFPLLGVYVVSCVGITSFACVVVVMHSLPNPERLSKKEIEKMEEADQMKSWTRLIVDTIKSTILRRNFFFLAIFQALNIVGFIVFLSFWD